MCDFCKVVNYDKYCTCAIDGNYCPFVRRCTKEMRWVELDSMATCVIRRDKMKGNVRFEKNGYLYVDVDGVVMKIKNPYDTTPQNVKVYKDKDGDIKIKKSK